LPQPYGGVLKLALQGTNTLLSIGINLTCTGLCCRKKFICLSL
jgi:hypothetical protein